MLRRILIGLVRLYQWLLAPTLRLLNGGRGNCRFTPTCSQYAIEALQRWGAARGLWLTLRRFSKCHPWGAFGYDPVPEKPERPQRDDELTRAKP